jgi:hypothetical protein
MIETKHIGIVLLCIPHLLFAQGNLALEAEAEVGSSVTTPSLVGGSLELEWDAAAGFALKGGAKWTSEAKQSFYVANTNTFSLKKLQLQLHEKFLYDHYEAWDIRDLNFFTGLTLLRGRFDGTLGLTTRIIALIDSYDETIVEPFNLQYDLGLSLFSQPKTWNIRLGASNYDDFLFERTENVIFSLGGNYRLSEQWRFHGSANLRPAGNFGLSADYYSFYINIGVRWLIH